jgi:hypothetical protein
VKRRGFKAWHGCCPPIEHAINSFVERWEPYSVASRRYSIFRLVKEEIDGPWRDYVARLKGLEAALLNGCVPGEYAHKRGFRALEDWVMRTIRSYNSLAQLAGASIDAELVASLETIRELATICGAKQPKKKSTGINTLRIRAVIFCELCGAPTELETYRRQGEYVDDSIGHAKLSARYCVDHRPRGHDGGFNAEYKRAVRNRVSFEKELLRLQLQSSKFSEASGNSGDPLVDAFIFNIIAQGALYPDERGELGRIAHHLTKEKVNDFKKRVVMMRVSGRAQSEIANELGVSRQAVSKALKSVPPVYRFDEQALQRGVIRIPQVRSTP